MRIMIHRKQAWTNCAHYADRVRSSAQNLRDALGIFGARTFFLVTEKKNIRSLSLCSDSTVNSKYYHERLRTCNNLIKFTNLMAPKLLYLPHELGKYLIN